MTDLASHRAVARSDDRRVGTPATSAIPAGRRGRGRRRAGRTSLFESRRRRLFAVLVLAMLLGILSWRLPIAALPAMQKFGPRVLRHQRLESGDEPVRRAGADLTARW